MVSLSAIIQAEAASARSPGHATELERQARRRDALRADFAKRFAGVTSCLLEPGCGHGHWLSAYAARHPQTLCVGLDLLGERIQKACAKVARAELTNIHFLKVELLECLECLPSDLKFTSIVFLFPDPWPKKRHHRRRMLRADTLTALAGRANPGTKLFFRSDDLDYVEWSREHLMAHPDWQLEPELPWLFEEETLFQRRMDRYQSLQARRV